VIRAELAALDDAGFDAAFGPLAVPGRDPAQWRLLSDAVHADVAGTDGPALALPPLAITPPARLPAPRIARPPRAARVLAVLAPLALAALALLALRAPTHGDPALLVPRGVSGPASPAPLDLDVAVKRASGIARLDPNAAYAVGDTLVFQVTLPEPATVAILRSAGGVEAAVWSGQVAAGAQTLPAGYTLDAGDPVATFTVRATSDSGAARSASVTVRGGVTP